MSFLSVNFLLFSLLTIVLYYISDNLIYRQLILIVSGIFFYLGFSSINLFYLLIVIIVTFYLEKQIAERKSKILLLIGIIILIGFLSAFKYTNLIMPVGISFYVFKMISYLVDAYNNKSKSVTLLEYSSYILFFPLITMGPINKSDKFVYHIRENYSFDYQNVRDGFLLFFFGFFEKIVIASRIRVLTDNIFSNYSNYNNIYLLLFMLLYTFEIYTDFDSYSNMAIGLSKMFGIKIEKNFNVPYLSKNIREFWRRWHISLSSWLKEYVYIPLGGNRKGELRKFLNILIVFTVSGIWHGNNFNFLIWGLLNGIAQIINIQYSKFVSTKFKTNLITIILSIMTTFITVNLLWIFFRTSNVSQAWYFISNILKFSNYELTYSLADIGIRDFFITMAFIGVTILTDVYRYNHSIIDNFKKLPLLFRWFIYTVMISVIIIFGIYGIDYNAGDFIYNQF